MPFGDTTSRESRRRATRPSRVVAAIVLALLFAGASWRAAVLAQNPGQAGTSQSIFGPKRYVRASSGPTQYSDTFVLPATARAPYILNVINGDDKGKNRISSATISLNGLEIVAKNDLNQQIARLDLPVSLQSSNTLRVTVAAGNPGSYITIGVIANVGPAGTTTSLTSNLNPSPFGQTVTFTAAVTGGATPATGTVTFLDGAASLGTGTLNGAGQATLATTLLPVGSHAITAR